MLRLVALTFTKSQPQIFPIHHSLGSAREATRLSPVGINVTSPKATSRGGGGPRWAWVKELKSAGDAALT
jgi:hypothetical protein